MKDNEFKCAMCGGIFEKGWTDEEAMKECKENFGEKMASAEDYEVVCNDCYQKICPQEHPHEVLMAQQEFNLGMN